jgi:hypothetical protein
MAAPSPRMLETDTSTPRVDENNSNQPPRVVETTTTAINRLRNRLRTKSVHNSGGSRPVRTNLVRKLQSITEETLPFTTGTTVRKSFKKGTLNGRITSYGEVPLKPVFFKHAAEVRDSPKFFKVLRIEIEKYPIIIRMVMY